MTRLRPLLLGIVASVLASLAFAPAALADQARSVQVVDQQGRVVDFLVYLDPDITATAGSTVSSKVVISGKEVPSTAQLVVETGANGARASILVLDTSGSMRGPKLKAAKQAAVDYVNALPPDVKVGLLTFNDKVTVEVSPPTSNRATVIDQINGVKAGQKTAVFDAVIAGLDQVRTPSAERLVLLSDGGDTASAATLDEVMARIEAEGVPIDVVALAPGVEHAALLKDMAQASGGQFLLATDANGLEQAFAQASGSFGGKVAVEATVPEDVDASGKFGIVTVTVDGTDYQGTSKLPTTPDLASTTGGTVAPPPVQGGGTAKPITPVDTSGSNWLAWMYALLAAVIVVIIALSVTIYRRRERSFLRTQQVLWYTSAVSEIPANGQRPDFKQHGLVDSFDGWLSTRKSYPAAEAKIDNSGLTMRPGAWLLIRIGICLGLVLFFMLLFRNPWIGTIVGALLGWLVTGAWINSRERQRRKMFEVELPDFLMLVASALRSGLSFNQALDSTAAEGKGEVSRQIRRALREVQMGSTIESALMRVSERMQSDDMKWTVTALAIQREVGGNLSNILDTAAETVQSRAKLRREVRTLSAEGRLSGWVLMSLPVGIFLYMLLANRTYVEFFWTNTWGYAALALIGVLFVAGFFWMRQLVKIEV
jgi:tight adherence protein B